MAAFAAAEKAKRRLIAELDELRLPIVGRDEDPQYGLAFDLLSSSYDTVVTGHEDGVITLDLAEGGDLHREQLRIAMDEPYRPCSGTSATRSGTAASTGSSGHRMSIWRSSVDMSARLVVRRWGQRRAAHPPRVRGHCQLRIARR
jgi:Putative zinc-binding metallo-peptidase